MLNELLMLFWAVSVLLIAIFATFSFGTADWIVAEGPAVTDLGYSRIRLGLVYACYEGTDGSKSCGV